MSLFFRPAGWSVIAGILLVVASGCASKGDDFYKHQPTFRPLEIPPDLTIPETNSGFEIPEVGSVETKKIRLGDNGVVILKKDGRLRWLEISASPKSVWNNTKDFWATKKIALSWQNLKLGLLETDWIKHYDSQFEKDRFRIRIEPGLKANTSELYLSHRGIQETMIDGEVISGWVNNFSDPELEIEVMGELLSYFGLANERKAALLDEAKKKSDNAKLNLKASPPNIVMNESAVRSWRFVMQAVDRMGHTVVERDKKANWLDVRLEADETADFTPGFALTNRDREVYRVQILTEDDVTTVTILNEQAQPDQSEEAKIFLKDLIEYL